MFSINWTLPFEQFQMVVAKPEGPKHLGFQAQRFLASRLDQATFMPILKMI